MRSIVFATDFLESSRLALDYAVAFSHHYKAKLTIAHAFELSPEAEEAELVSQRPSLSRERACTRLEALAAGLQRQGVTAAIDLSYEEPCTAILKSAEKNGADLLVLGTHGVYRGIQHVLVGSNAEKILLSSPCPTLTVGRHVMTGIDLELRFDEILYVTDFSMESVAAAHYALALGRDLGIDTVLLPVAKDRTAGDDTRLRPAIERFCAALARDATVSEREWCEPAYHLQHAVSPEHLLGRSRACPDSLLVLGVHRESRWNRHLHASFAYELVAKASCPLLSIQATEFDPQA